MSRMIEKSGGNVFADIGVPNAKQELLKAKLTLQVHRLLTELSITQADAAKLLGTTQPQVSALLALKPVSVSVGRLMEFLTVLGQDVKVTVKSTPRKRAGITVTARITVTAHSIQRISFFSGMKHNAKTPQLVAYRALKTRRVNGDF